MSVVHFLEHGAAPIARTVLTRLPEWFGRPGPLAAYVAAADRLPTLAAYVAVDEPVGFATLERHTDVAAQIHVMGVLPDHHGKGIGRALIEEAERFLAPQGFDGSR